MIGGSGSGALNVRNNAMRGTSGCPAVESLHDCGGALKPLAGSERSGFDQSLMRTITGSTDPNAPTITLNLDARAGQITVDRP